MDFTKPHIYKRQIIATGKCYVGKHKGGDKYYYGSGIEYKKDLSIYKDILTEILEYVEDISKLNEREKYWLEYFDGDQQFQIKESIRELKSVQDIRKSSAFGVAKVSSVKNVCINNKLTVKIVYTPRDKILSHSEIRQLPMDDLLIQEALAYEAFTKLIPNSEIEDLGSEDLGSHLVS